MERKQLAPGVCITTLDAAKFNRCRITLHLRFPARRESATDAAVLALVLERGYAACPDMTALSRRLAELYFIPGGALGIAVATFSSQNLGAGKRSRIWQSVKAALVIYFVWWVFIMAFTFLCGEAAVRGVTGSNDEIIIANALLYLKISVPIIPPMAVLVILRNMLQGIQHTIEPLLASALELIGKVIFAVWLVPVWGYRAVCFCEPTTWVICFVFILFAAWRCRGDLRDA